MISKKIAIIGLVVVFLINFYPGFTYKLYESVPLFDISLHFLGGFFVAMLVFSFYHNEFRKNSSLFQFLSLTGITVLVGVMWEFFEFGGSFFLTDIIYNSFKVKIYFIGDLTDTIMDLFMDISGAIIYWVISMFHRSSFKSK